MRTIFALAIIGLCVTLTLAQDDANQPFKSAPAARPILTKYEQEVEAASKQFETRVSQARAACIASLKRSQEAETKKGNLEGALEIKAKVEDLEKEQPTSKAIAKAAVGRWRHDNGTGDTVVIRDDSTCVFNNRVNGKLMTTTQTQTQIKWGNGAVYTFINVTDSRIELTDNTGQRSDLERVD